jgi:hypothetical protein
MKIAFIYIWYNSTAIKTIKSSKTINSVHSKLKTAFDIVYL